MYIYIYIHIQTCVYTSSPWQIFMQDRPLLRRERTAKHDARGGGNNNDNNNNNNNNNDNDQ